MKNLQKLKQQQKLRRHKRVRAKISGTKTIPRLSVYRSLNHIYAQLIDDIKGNTIITESTKTQKTQKHKNTENTKAQKTRKSEDQTRKIIEAYAIGKQLAERAQKIGIKKVVFDKGPYKFHGRVKALAEGARDGGLKF